VKNAYIKHSPLFEITLHPIFMLRTVWWLAALSPTRLSITVHLLNASLRTPKPQTRGWMAALCSTVPLVELVLKFPTSLAALSPNANFRLCPPKTAILRHHLSPFASFLRKFELRFSKRLPLFSWWRHSVRILNSTTMPCQSSPRAFPWSLRLRIGTRSISNLYLFQLSKMYRVFQFGNSPFIK